MSDDYKFVPGETKIKFLERQRVDMDIAYQPFDQLYRELADYLCPALPQFAISDINLGDRRSPVIVDPSATLAGNILKAGMVSSISSPSRPWFKVALQNSALNDDPEVKQWLTDVNDKMFEILVKSNFYAAIQVFYGYGIFFGTPVITMEEDLDGKVVRFQTLPIGSYRLLDDNNGRCCGIARTYRMTVLQIIQEFAKWDEGKGTMDWSNISTNVKDLWESGQFNAVVDVCHIVVPNPAYAPRRPMAKDKKFWSCYYELGQANQIDGKFLRESGFDDFPALVFRWSRNPGDVYATDCPGMTVLPDVCQLQAMENKRLIAIEKIIDPPIVVPDDMSPSAVNMVPGGITFSSGGKSEQIRPLHTVPIDLNHYDQTQIRIRDRISRAFYVDIFRQISQFDEVMTGKMTATEVRARQQEGMRILGPVLEQLNGEVFAPMISRLFKIMVKQNVIPKPPRKIQGEQMTVEYISIMSQAQKLEGLGSSERFLGILMQAAQADANVLKGVRLDVLVAEMGKILSVAPKVFVPEEQVRAQEAAERRMAMQQAQAEILQKGGQGMQALSAAQPQMGSAMGDQLGMMQQAGITPPVPVAQQLPVGGH